MSVRLDVDIRHSEVGMFMRSLQSDQLPFATALAVNRTTLDFQRAERARGYDIFTIRRKRFWERSVKISKFAQKAEPDPHAVARIEAPGGTRSDIFAKFEASTTKGPFRGRSVAVPTDRVPRTAAGVIRKGWRPRELLEKSTPHGRGRVFGSKGDVFRGSRRTFLIRRPGGRGTIFERDGGEIFALYQLVPRVRIEPELEFVKTARRTVLDRWAPNFIQAFDRAIGTARRR